MICEGDAHPPPAVNALWSVRFVLDERHGEDRDGEKNRDKRFGVAGEIKVDHGVFRPFTVLDGSPPGKVYRVTDLS
jgi:hypothetical protein